MYVLTIDGGAHTEEIDAFDISDPANGIGMLRCAVLSEDGSYVPVLDKEAILTEDGVRIFAGHIDDVEEHGAFDVGLTPIVCAISATDFNALASRRYFSEPIPAGTLKAALTQLLPYLAGVTLDAGQVDGPALPELLYTAWKAQDVLDQLCQIAGGWVWEINYFKVLRAYEPGAVAAPFNIVAGDGKPVGDVTSHPTRTRYANRILVFGTGVFALVEDAGEETAYGVWETVVRDPDLTTQAAADVLGAAVLASSLPVNRTVIYDTHETGLVAGQTQSINLPIRHINNTYLLTEIHSRCVGAGPTLRTVTAIEGLVFQPGWRETVKSWGGVGGGIAAPGVGGGSVSFVRVAYPMGGSKLEPVRTDGGGGGWVFVGHTVEINTVPRGTTSAIVYLSLSVRDAGISVKARLFDKTASVACSGDSAPVTSLTPEFLSFATTLTAGTHRYQLQVQPSTADRDVIAEGIHAI